ncbi:MAG TPA: hypothetical protein VK034_30935 [Enhygromyxa sp.]|nr:hypothetical protein [Enhygromyxa sp.]
MIAEELDQLVFHVLAHAPLSGPGNVHDRRYVAWAAERFDAADRRMLDHDAALLARLWNADPRYDALHRIGELHHDLAGLLACADRPLAELRPDEVADPRLLATIHELPGAELLHATLALLAPGFARVFAELRPILEQASAGFRGWLDRLDPACPGLASARVELVWALGLHGRALGSRILVGAPADWNGCAPARQAVLAAHEHTVARVSEHDYVADEWAALTELADRLRDADPTVQQAHRDWLASLDLSSLLAAAVERGYLSKADADALNHDRHDRPARLSAARAGG